jgi:tubulin polyglutamylase TTLL6/13
MCFEILGFDVMLDDKLKPWIIEVNHSPSFTTDSPIDFKIKKNLIIDTIKLLNLSYWKKLQYKQNKTKEFQRRAIKGKIKVTPEEKEEIRRKKARKRDNYEKKNSGNYSLMYPSEEFPVDTH